MSCHECGFQFEWFTNFCGLFGDPHNEIRIHKGEKIATQLLRCFVRTPSNVVSAITDFDLWNSAHSNQLRQPSLISRSWFFEWQHPGNREVGHSWPYSREKFQIVPDQNWFRKCTAHGNTCEIACIHTNFMSVDADLEHRQKHLKTWSANFNAEVPMWSRSNRIFH